MNRQQNHSHCITTISSKTQLSQWNNNQIVVTVPPWSIQKHCHHSENHCFEFNEHASQQQLTLSLWRQHELLHECQHSIHNELSVHNDCHDFLLTPFIAVIGWRRTNAKIVIIINVNVNRCVGDGIVWLCVLSGSVCFHQGSDFFQWFLICVFIFLSVFFHHSTQFMNLSMPSSDHSPFVLLHLLSSFSACVFLFWSSVFLFLSFFLFICVVWSGLTSETMDCLDCCLNDWQLLCNCLICCSCSFVFPGHSPRSKGQMLCQMQSKQKIFLLHHKSLCSIFLHKLVTGCVAWRQKKHPCLTKVPESLPICTQVHG